MKLKLNKNHLLVIQEKDDPKFYGVRNAVGESRLLHHIKKQLNKLTTINGQSAILFIKKRMHKDGHLVDEMQQYLRSKKPYKKGYLAIYNGMWAIEGAEAMLNRDGVVRLSVEYI